MCLINYQYKRYYLEAFIDIFENHGGFGPDGDDQSEGQKYLCHVCVAFETYLCSVPTYKAHLPKCCLKQVLIENS
jgi:hypothetical protein